ncbi:hypothetical protein OGAPHI_000788 [Ogataea philodendri]|uniref:tRNA dimethylallyltransferase n=1 Tax=Ogataea philodendri TaxID=1378263 RepID=A0A9P8PFU6_9ASCO|nr:uncharacterized protein OGAPHI_000788 [Ogataea philodendri]KAH3671077.1 hypothetical protein OGAPHI_000788 [Ogataea philodendri]
MGRRVISVIGTTGVGKSQFAVELARAIDGEIINADSMQMYRGLDQITNKHPVNERYGVPHHVMDHVAWDAEYYIHRFKQEAMEAIEDIHSRGKTAILVGGTHYYLQSLLFLNRTLDGTQAAKLSEEEQAILDGPADKVFETLMQKDPKVAQKFHPNDRRRVRRALEIYFSTKTKTSELYGQQRQQTASTLRYNTLFFWLYAKTAVLDTRLDSRVDKMIQHGALDEVRQMNEFYQQMDPKMELDRGVWQVIGYKELVPCLDSSESLESCVETMKRATRRYARKQVRWIANTLSRELAVEEEHGWMNGGRIITLDATDLDSWEQTVAQRGISICNEFLAGSTLANYEAVPKSLQDELKPKETFEYNDETKWKHYYCETCVDSDGNPKLFLGEHIFWHLFSQLFLGRGSLRFADVVVVADDVLLDELGGQVGGVWFLRNEQVEEDTKETGHGKAGFHHQDDGVEESRKRFVVTGVGEDVVEPVTNKRGAETEHERAGQDESVSSCERSGGDNLETGNSNRGEQEGGHSSEHGAWDGNQCSGELRKHSHDNQEEAAPVSNGSGCALGDGDDTVVLGKGGHWGHGHQSGDDTIETVGKHTSLDSGLVQRTLDVCSGHITGGGDISDCFHHQHDVARQKRQHNGTINGEFEGVDPHEGDGWSSVDVVVREVATSSSDNAADKQSNNDSTGLHDRRTPFFTDNDGDVDKETETDELGGSPVVTFGTRVGSVYTAGATNEIFETGRN